MKRFTLLLATGASAPLVVQSQPAYRSFDANGVNLVRGDYLIGFSGWAAQGSNTNHGLSALA